jgi:hypothetical protein
MLRQMQQVLACGLPQSQPGVDPSDMVNDNRDTLQSRPHHLDQGAFHMDLQMPADVGKSRGEIQDLVEAVGYRCLMNLKRTPRKPRGQGVVAHPRQRPGAAAQYPDRRRAFPSAHPRPPGCRSRCTADCTIAQRSMPSVACKGQTAVPGGASAGSRELIAANG